MNKKGQIGAVIEGIVGILILLAMLPLLFQIGDIAKPQKDIVVNNTAVEQAKNLLSQLEICQKNYEDLNKSVITKNDLLDLTSVVKSINQNVMNIYEMNTSYIENHISLTIEITITLTLMFSLGIFTLLDATIFKFELAKGLFRTVKRRFTKDE
ncbi:hypothetical protein J4444_01630 [Candidatus Woesearchaeota archaeon]|nr:hypothetical protein [Candidatus Woesearchaeota archaeon]